MRRCVQLGFLVSLLTIPALWWAPSPAAAQGLIIAQPLPVPRPGPIPLPRPQPLSVKAERVDLRIDSGAVRAQVSETFRNPSSTAMEGTYLFNLPEGAA